MKKQARLGFTPGAALVFRYSLL